MEATALRVIAEWFEEKEIDLPDYVTIHSYGDVPTVGLMSCDRDLIVALAKAIPTAKKVYLDEYFQLVGRFDGFCIEATTDRDVVCKKVVTGIERVEVPATEAQIIEREIVEWTCEPLLKAATT